jgi:excisionase family DNA binding protein
VIVFAGGEAGARRVLKVRCVMGAGERPRDKALAEVRFLTVAEVATVMRVSKMTVYRLVHSGELPAVRVGRSFRVPEQAVHSYLRDAFIEAG